MTDFDRLIERRGTDCIKYDSAMKRMGRDDLLPLWVADMDFAAPDEILSALHDRIDHGIFGYTEPGEAYHKALCSWFAARYGYKIDASWNTVAPGVVYAIACAIRVMTAPGDAVIIQTPVYYPFSAMIRANGRRLITSELLYDNGSYRMDTAGFEHLIETEDVRLFILCSPHNPVGRVWTKDELEDIASICKRHGVGVIADEIHCDFIYPGHTFTPYLTLDNRDETRTILCTAPSKSFNLAGLQIANILIPDETLRKRYRKENQANGYGEAGIMGLTAAQAAYEKGAPWLDSLCAYLNDSLDYVRDFLREKLPEVRLVEPEGTYLIWLDLSGLHLSDRELKDFIIDKAHLWLDDGGMFGEHSGQFTRINIACTRATLERAMTQLYDAVRQLM